MAKPKLKIVEVEAPAKPKELLRLDLGAGQNCREGFKSVDFYAKADFKCDLFSFPWLAIPKAPSEHLGPVSTDWKLNEKEYAATQKGALKIKDSSVEEAHCSHFFEHVPHLLRGKFMDELYRVLCPGGKATIITPYYNSVRATQDFTHEWPPVSPNSFLYFNKGWREGNKLTHGYYDLVCDFDYVYGYALQGIWASKSEDSRNFAIQHYNEVVADLHVTLTSRKPQEARG